MSKLDKETAYYLIILFCRKCGIKEENICDCIQPIWNIIKDKINE